MLMDCSSYQGELAMTAGIPLSTTSMEGAMMLDINGSYDGMQNIKRQARGR